jgi:SAM-dependent methyltransferase
MPTRTKRTTTTESLASHYGAREAETYDVEYAWKRDDVEFWKGMARDFGAGGPLLELGCGTLRVLLPLAREGHTLVGLDGSPHMLARARQKLAKETAEVRNRVTLVEADFRTFQLDQKFAFIYLPFNTILGLTTTADQLALFDRVRAHLKRGGLFAFDLFTPDPGRLTNEPRWVQEVDETDLETGFRFQRDFVREIDPRHQILNITFRMREYRGDEFVREWLSRLVMSYIFPRELEHLVARAGFEFVHYWGEYDRTNFWEMREPEKQIAVVRVRKSDE